MTAFHQATLSLANFNIDDLYDSTPFVMASQLTLFGDFTVNISAVMLHVQPEALQFWGCGQILPFIIKRIFPCSFENKHMRLLTREYGNLILSVHVHVFVIY